MIDQSLWSKRMNNFEYSLRQLLNTQIDPTLFPVDTDECIKLGDYTIHFDDKYIIRHCAYIMKLGHTYTKHGALALVKTHSRNRDQRNLIYQLDKQFFHNTNSLVFLQHAMNSNDNKHLDLDVLQTKIIMASTRAKYAKHKLRSMIQKC